MYNLKERRARRNEAKKERFVSCGLIVMRVGREYREKNAVMR